MVWNNLEFGAWADRVRIGDGVDLAQYVSGDFVLLGDFFQGFTLSDDMRQLEIMIARVDDFASQRIEDSQEVLELLVGEFGGIVEEAERSEGFFQLRRLICSIAIFLAFSNERLVVLFAKPFGFDSSLEESTSSADGSDAKSFDLGFTDSEGGEGKSVVGVSSVSLDGVEGVCTFGISKVLVDVELLGVEPLCASEFVKGKWRRSVAVGGRRCI